MQLEITKLAADFLFSDNVDSSLLITFDGPDPPGGIDSGTLDDMINPAVRDPLFSYLATNFFHNSAGGTGPLLPLCTSMNQVWEFLRCENFDEGNLPEFLEFRDPLTTDPYISEDDKDPRRQISAALLRCAESGRQDKWEDAIDAVHPLPEPFPADGTLELPIGYSPFMNPTRCRSALAIPTGIMIDVGGGRMEPDAACTAPGCSYDRRRGRCQ